jgi:hypothetical protein
VALEEAEVGRLQKRLVEVTEEQLEEHSSWHLVVAMEVEGEVLSLRLAEVMEVEQAVLSWHLVAMVEAAEVSLQMMELEELDELKSAVMVEAEALSLVESCPHLH